MDEHVADPWILVHIFRTVHHQQPLSLSLSLSLQAAFSSSFLCTLATHVIVQHRIVVGLVIYGTYNGEGMVQLPERF